MIRRFVSLFVATIACLASCAFAQSKQIQVATDRVAAELEKGPRLELPPPSPEAAAVEVPEHIHAAGEEFVAAWKLYHRFSLATAPPKPVPAAKEPQRPAGEKDLSIERLIQRTIDENPPPALAEYWAAFEIFNAPAYADCGQVEYERVLFCDSLLALRNLKAGDYLVAYRQLGTIGHTKARESILRAYGIDPEDIHLGAWLHGNPDFDAIRQHGKEKSASMLLKWAEIRWNKLGKHAVRDQELKLPAFPDQVLISFLRPANGVTDETKGKIAQFLATNGVQIQPVSYWLKAMQEGAETWMVPLAKLGLNDELNLTRERASALLTKAGIPHDPPVMKQPAKLRVTVNGQPLPKDLANPKKGKSHLNVTLALTERSSRGFYTWMKEDGVFEVNLDELAGLDIKEARLTFPQNNLSVISTPAEPFLETTLALPLQPGELRDIDFPSVAVTIRPKLPASRRTPARLMEIEFGPVSRESTPRGCLYHLKGADELILPYVSPGEYWLRVRHPGTALMPWTKVKVGPNEKLLAPRLEAGSTLVVPLGPSKPQIPESWPPELIDSLGLSRGHMENIVHLWRGNELVTEWVPIPEGSDEHFPNSVIFANLPPGDYEVRTRRMPTTDPSFQLIEPRTIKVSIRPDSPVYQLTEPLELKLNALPKEKEGD